MNRCYPASVSTRFNSSDNSAGSTPIRVSVRIRAAVITRDAVADSVKDESAGLGAGVLKMEVSGRSPIVYHHGMIHV